MKMSGNVYGITCTICHKAVYVDKIPHGGIRNHPEWKGYKRDSFVIDNGDVLHSKCYEKRKKRRDG